MLCDVKIAEKTERRILGKYRGIIALRPPFRNDYFDDDEFDDMDFEQNNRHISAEMAGLFIQDMINREKGKVAPDTTGADFFFLRDFIIGDMEFDFAAIEQDFLKHCSDKLQEFNKAGWYGDTDFKTTSPKIAMQRRILRLMYNGAKTRDSYCLELMNYLYKTYHKKEYKQLKRFSTISTHEIFSLAEDEWGGNSYEAMGRILGMCTFMNIKLADDCSILYLLLEKMRKEWIKMDEEGTAFLLFKEGLFEECLTQVDLWETEYKSPTGTRRQHKVYWDENEFIGACLNNQGFSNDYVYMCMENNMGLRMQMARTLAVLRTKHPNKNYSYEDVQHYTQLYSVVAALTDVAETFNYDLGYLTGDPIDEFEAEYILFKPEKIIVREKDEKRIKETKVISHIAQANIGTASENDYLQELSELRKKINEQEQENRFLRNQYRQEKNYREELEKVNRRYEEERDELISLREYAYRSEQEQLPLESDEVTDLDEKIRDKQIVIIGGHINWINKLKQQFPKWLYIHPDSYKLVDGKILNGKEKVYFFTDYMNHVSYAKYIAAVRERKIPFGYLGSRNIDYLVRQIAEDLLTK